MKKKCTGIKGEYFQKKKSVVSRYFVSFSVLRKLDKISSSCCLFYPERFIRENINFVSYGFCMSSIEIFQLQEAF